MKKGTPTTLETAPYHICLSIVEDGIVHSENDLIFSTNSHVIIIVSAFLEETHSELFWGETGLKIRRHDNCEQFFES